MLAAGDPAPDFRLPGTDGDDIQEYRLRDYTSDGPVILSFYPFDFAPQCTKEACGLRDTEWFQFMNNTTVLAISTDGPFSHMEFSTQYDLNFPLLCDTDATVAETFGCVHEEWNGFERIMQRATYLIDDEQTVRHVTAMDDPLEEPALEPVREAADELGATF